MRLSTLLTPLLTLPLPVSAAGFTNYSYHFSPSNHRHIWLIHDSILLLTSIRERCGVTQNHTWYGDSTHDSIILPNSAVVVYDEVSTLAELRNEGASFGFTEIRDILWEMERDTKRICFGPGTVGREGGYWGDEKEDEKVREKVREAKEKEFGEED